MSLVDKITDKSALVGVIGLGYVGLPLVIEFCRAGFKVFGFDNDPEKVESLKQGKSYIKHIDVTEISNFQSQVSDLKADSKRKTQNSKMPFIPTSDLSLLAQLDCIIVCVPTPLNENREPDMTYVFNTTETIAINLRKGQLVVLESTTYPGTTDEDMREILEKTGLKAGEDFYLAFSPEREDPNNSEFSLRTTPKVVGGYTPKCLEAALALYNSIVIKTVPVSSTRAAEATKLIENTYRAVNIALVNELKMLFDKMGIDIWETIEAAKSKPFGFQAFYPGPGLGGHCIPIDPFYLTWKAREYEFSTRFVELAGDINTSMPDFVVTKVIKALNDFRKPVKGSNILLLGLAYKANIDDDRESPSYHLMEKLEKMGSYVSYNDPYISVIKLIRKYPQFAGRYSVEISGKYDLMLIATPHDAYKNIDFFSFNIPIVDTRNIVHGKSKFLYKA
jgi:UDP-N-acetyl-D-glucosamine dehydrogenase